MRIFKSFGLFILVGIAAIGSANTVAQATTLVIEGDQLAGANNVNVGGIFYNVIFVEGSCFALFGGCNELSDFAFTDQATALLASTALMNDVFLDGTNFDLIPELTKGISWVQEGQIYTPYGTDNTLVSLGIFKNLPEELGGVDSVVAGVTQIIFDTTATVENPLIDNRTYAQWEAVSVVPLPPSALLFGTALLGLAGIRRRKRSV